MRHRPPLLAAAGAGTRPPAVQGDAPASLLPRPGRPAAGSAALGGSQGLPGARPGAAAARVVHDLAGARGAGSQSLCLPAGLGPSPGLRRLPSRLKQHLPRVAPPAPERRLGAGRAMPWGRQDAAVPAAAPPALTRARRTPFGNRMNENNRSCVRRAAGRHRGQYSSDLPHSTQRKWRKLRPGGLGAGRCVPRPARCRTPGAPGHARLNGGHRFLETSSRLQKESSCPLLSTDFL